VNDENGPLKRNFIGLVFRKWFENFFLGPLCCPQTDEIIVWYFEI
jgi:hypothetical protein